MFMVHWLVDRSGEQISSSYAKPTSISRSPELQAPGHVSRSVPAEYTAGQQRGRSGSYGSGLNDTTEFDGRPRSGSYAGRPRSSFRGRSGLHDATEFDEQPRSGSCGRPGLHDTTEFNGRPRSGSRGRSVLHDIISQGDDRPRTGRSQTGVLAGSPSSRHLNGVDPGAGSRSAGPVGPPPRHPSSGRGRLVTGQSSPPIPKGSNSTAGNAVDSRGCAVWGPDSGPSQRSLSDAPSVRIGSNHSEFSGNFSLPFAGVANASPGSVQRLRSHEVRTPPSGVSRGNALGSSPLSASPMTHLQLSQEVPPTYGSPSHIGARISDGRSAGALLEMLANGIGL